MSGRQEQDNKREFWIANKLVNAPQLYIDYMRSINLKTSSTRKAYLGYLFQFYDFLLQSEIDLLEVKPMHIDAYRDYMLKMNNKASIINAKLSAIISFYDFLKENEFISNNPCSAKKKLKIEEKSTVIYMTDEEVKEVKGNAAISKTKYCNRDLCILNLGCSTGLRVSAIINIDLDDIDFDNKTITVIEKGNKKRVICIGENTLNSISKWMMDRQRILGENQEQALFINQKTRKRMSPEAVQRMIKRYSKTIDKHITPHKMRSTCAMKLYDKTGDIYLTAQQLGHKNIKNTMIYAKATENKLRQAAEILD